MNRVRYLNDPVHEYARRNHVLGVYVAAANQLLRLHDRRFCSHAHQRAEVAGGLVEQQVAERVSDLALY